MRAPQFGHNKGKRRGSHAVPAQPKLWRVVGLAGPNQPLPMRRIRYLTPRQVQYPDGSYGAKVTLHLYHKSAKAMNGEGPIVTKQSTVVVNTRKK